MLSPNAKTTHNINNSCWTPLYGENETQRVYCSECVLVMLLCMCVPLLMILIIMSPCLGKEGVVKTGDFSCFGQPRSNDWVLILYENGNNDFGDVDVYYWKEGSNRLRVVGDSSGNQPSKSVFIIDYSDYFSCSKNVNILLKKLTPTWWCSS